jgi:hypothetical protein
MFILFITLIFEIMTQTYVSNFIFNNYKFGFNGLQHGEGGYYSKLVALQGELC